MKRNVYPGKEVRYNVVDTLYSIGDIKSFKEIFKYVPPTEVAQKISLSLPVLKRKIESPKEFSPEEKQRMADLFMIPIEGLEKLIVA